MRPPAWAWGLAFLAAYVAVDRASFFQELYPIGITPWNPPPGVALAFLILAGWRAAPWVVAAGILSDWVVRDWPAPVALTAAAALLLTTVYWGTADLLRRTRFDPRFTRPADVGLLTAAALLAPALLAYSYVALFAWAGMVPRDEADDAVLQYWIGDALGIIVFTPATLLLRTAFASGIASSLLGHDLRAVAEIAVQSAAVVAALAFLQLRSEPEEFRYFYLLLLPVIWIAVRHGIQGAILAVAAVQVGLLVFLQANSYPLDRVQACQQVMFAIAVTGLLLGAVVSERRRVAEALAISEARLEAILDSAPDAILSVGADGRIAGANRMASLMFGPPAERLATRRLDELLDLEGGATGAGLSPAQLASEAPQLGNTLARHDDGRRFAVELGTSALSGGIRTVVIRDISGRVAAEERLRQVNAELAHATRLAVSGEMASAIAHELNQPLTAVLTYSRIVRRLLNRPAASPEAPGRDDSGPLAEAAEQIERQAERASDIIRTLRQFMIKGEAVRRQLDLVPLIQETVQLVQIEAARRGGRLYAHAQAALPPVRIDPIQVQQVLINLIRNGLEAAGAGGRPALIRITAAMQGDEVVIGVADNGPGIELGLDGRLFHPFVTSKADGMGLGLSISRTLIEAHGGRLWLERSDGNGALFRFTLPVAR